MSTRISFEPPHYSNTFPPRNRADPAELAKTLQMELIDAMGTMRMDPTRAAVAGMLQALPVLESADVGVSVLSGKPGVRFRNYEGLDLVLTREELIRMFRRELHAEEVRKLRDLLGVFHDIHDDFYDEETLTALQPMSER